MDSDQPNESSSSPPIINSLGNYEDCSPHKNNNNGLSCKLSEKEVSFDSKSLGGSDTVDGNGPVVLLPPPTSNGMVKKRLGSRMRLESSDTEGSEASTTLERAPPDGGWGWVVVGAAFFVNLIADGVTFSFGIFFKEFLDYFQNSKSATAWIGSLLAAMPLLSGPIASFLTDKLGCRKVTIIGGLLASLGFLLSYYADSVEMLILTFGVITGFGLSLCYVAAVVIVAYYFEKRRSLATGLSVCGGGIGTFIFSPVTSKLIDAFGWRGAALILAGCFLNLCVCGILMRDLEWTKKKGQKSPNAQKRTLEKNSWQFKSTTSTLTWEDKDGDTSSTRSVANKKNNHERLCNSAICIPTFFQDQERDKPHYNSAQHQFCTDLATKTNNKATPKLRIPSFSRKFRDEGPKTTSPPISSSYSYSNNNFVVTAEKDKRELIRDETEDKDVAIIFESRNSNSNNNEHQPNNGLSQHTNFCSGSSTYNHSSNENNGAQEKNMETQVPAIMVTSNVNNNSSSNGLVHSSSGNVEPNGNGEKVQKTTPKNLAVNNGMVWSGLHRHSLTYRGAVLNLKRYRLRPATSCPDIISMAAIEDPDPRICLKICGRMCNWFKTVCDWHYLTNTGFLLFLLSNLLLYTWYDVPYMYLQDAALQHGYSDDLSSYLISIIGLFNMMGNVILGYLGDKKWSNAVAIYGVCMALCGAATVTMPYCLTWDYATLSVACAIFGMTIAANYSLTSVILVKVVSIERFASAYGLLLWVQGIGNLVGPPIAGVIYDYTGTSSWSFIVAGSGIFGSCLFLLTPKIFINPDDIDVNEPNNSNSSSEAA